MGADALSSDFAGPILVVRRDNIGDLVCTTPLIDALRKACPQARLEALVNSYNAPVLAGNPALDAVNVYTKLKHRAAGTSLAGAVLERWTLLRQLRRKRFKLAVLARSGFDRHGLDLVRWLGIPRVAGFAPAGARPAALTLPVPQVDNNAVHEVEAIARLAEALGVANATGPLRVYPEAGLLGGFRARLAGAPFVVGVHISAREASRRLPEDKWIAAIRAMAQRRPDAAFALFWAPGAQDDPRHPGDDGMAARILAALAGLRVFPCPTARLDELIAGVAACSVFVGADGGALHVAAATGRPCVGLFENSAFKRLHWAPWQVPHVLVSASAFAVGEIQPEAIADAFASVADRA